MKERIYAIEYAGHSLRCRFLYPMTRRNFCGRAIPVPGEEYDVGVTPELIEKGRTQLPPDSSDDYVEYRCLIPLTGQALLKYGCCILHCASFVWRGYAWLLTAPSGTGKTTQYRNWVNAHPGEIRMISGDMPVLEPRGDGSIWAHPSPWNGKENIGNRISAPIGGVVFLEQGKENVLSRPPVAELLRPVFCQFITRLDTEEEIRSLGCLADRMFSALPVWKLVNVGDAASTELLRSAFMERLPALDRRA